MEIVIKGTPKEIAALVVAVQERQQESSENMICKTGVITREQLSFRGLCPEPRGTFGKEVKMDISQIKTCDLVRELQCREGVETKIAGPHEDATLQVNGPAIVLVVVD